MPKNLVIVESPSKSKTIEKYLGSDFRVLSSKGHIRDLSTTGKYGLGVDVDNDFKPSYIPIHGKEKTISDLKKEVKASIVQYSSLTKASISRSLSTISFKATD